jgi:hypothetical protein
MTVRAGSKSTRLKNQIKFFVHVAVNKQMGGEAEENVGAFYFF